ncbi:hypothetical protein [Sessilibacter sp. MAH2]
MSQPIKFSSLLLLLSSSAAFAGTTSVDRVYDPYVQPLEREIEFRNVLEHDPFAGNDVWKTRFGYGQSLSERLFLEFYVVGEKEQGEAIEEDSYEIELKWQLTEQGEYSSDWGLLFEFEDELGQDVLEAAVTLIGLKEYNRFIFTGNLSAIIEWGGDINDEFETAFAGQSRYRLSQSFEPGLELYQSETTSAFGPVFSGVVKLGGRKRLTWETGILFPLDDETANQTYKINFDFEF